MRGLETSVQGLQNEAQIVVPVSFILIVGGFLLMRDDMEKRRVEDQAAMKTRDAAMETRMQMTSSVSWVALIVAIIKALYPYIDAHFKATS